MAGILGKKCTAGGTDEVMLTAHAEGRLYERFELDRDKALVYAERAWRNGHTVEKYDGKAFRYLKEIENRYEGSMVILRIHSNVCFIFSNERVLITAYVLGDDFLRINHKKTSRYREIDPVDSPCIFYVGIFLYYLLTNEIKYDIVKMF